MLPSYNSNLRKYPSLDTIGVPREYHWIPRKFKPFNRQNFHQTKNQCIVSLRWSVSWTDTRLAELSTSLRQLCRLHADYKPESEHYQSFNAIKKELYTKIVLPYYDPASHTTLQTDSFNKGLRAILIQNETPIYFASRAISPTECNYKNLEC